MAESLDDHLSDAPVDAGLRAVFERQGSQCGGPDVESVLRAVWQQAGLLRPEPESRPSTAEKVAPLARLSADEQEVWRALWDDVQALLRNVEQEQKK